MKKIVFLTHNLGHDNGAGVFATAITNGLESRGYEIEILTTVPSGNKQEKAILYPNKIKLFLSFFKIRKILKSADILHVMDIYPYGVIAYLFGFGLHKRTLMTLIGSGSIIPVTKGRFKWLYKKVLRSADNITAISRYVRDEVKKRLGDINIEVVTPGIDYKKLSREPDKKYFDEGAKYVPYILSVGSLRWRKGYQFSIRAYAKLLEKFPDLKYVIVGKKYADKMYQELMDLKDELNLDGKLFILDNVDDIDQLKALYRDASVFGLMSQNIGHDVEGFGMVFLEAAVQGLSVVGSKDCGVEDAMLDQENGFLIREDDMSGFAEAVGKILENSQLRESMSQKSREFASQNDWENKISAYNKLIEGILE